MQASALILLTIVVQFAGGNGHDFWGDDPKSMSTDGELIQHSERVRGLGGSEAEEFIGSEEAEFLLSRVRQCWNVDPNLGSTPAVEVIATLNQSGMVTEARVADEGRYRADGRFRAAADSALRAVLNPACQPFPLPADQWPAWQTIRFNFDPADLF